MPSQLRVLFVAFGRHLNPFVERPRSFAAVLVLAVVEGCTALPKTASVGADPSNPATRTPAAGYRSTTAPYTSRRPADPVPWREQNQRVTPRLTE